ncbi:MAG: histidine kinase N-terminal 7TM domain-containing protein [Candidatus Marinimicrobia bacterium]|nr:histidine kinase N-terminal 7TM domain-containing protein [Candidatus Neomarinimicrobiota bacterium]
MNYQFGIFSGLLFSSFLISLSVAIYSLKQRQVKSGFYLMLLAAAIAEWALAGFFEAAATQLAHKILWSQISYLGIVFTPPLYLIFALSYGQHTRLITKRNIIIASIIPVLSLLMAITNDLHHWIWINVSISTEGNIGLYDHGFWFLIHIAYSYTMILAGMIIIIRTVKRGPSLFRSQMLIMILGAALPLLANFIYVFGANPIPGLDWTPLAFGVSGLLMGIGIFRYNILNTIPIARNILVETMHDGVLVIDPNDRVLDINPSMTMIIDRTSIQVIGEPLSEVLSEWPEALACINEHFETQTNISKISTDQQEHYDFQVTRIVNLDGSNIGRLVVCRDNTEKITAQLDLAESQIRLKTLSNAATEAIFISEKGICLELNRTAERMFGYSLAEAIGKSSTDWIIPEHRDRFLENIQSGFDGPYEVTALRKDGSTFLSDVRAKLMQYKGRKVHITILRDITERKHAEERKEQALLEAHSANKVKDQFIANISHEFRTPLTSINGFISHLKHSLEKKLEPEELDSFMFINQSSERLLQTVDEILSVSQLEAGSLQLTPRLFHLGQLIHLICVELRPQAHAKGLEINCLDTVDDDNIWFDEYSTKQAIHNIIQNAIKYTDEGNVTVKLDRVDKQLILTISDTGIGISDEYHERIFQPFSQESEGFTKRYQGIGLGLALAKRFLDLNQVQLEVKSKKGEGSTFKLTFPENLESHR